MSSSTPVGDPPLIPPSSPMFDTPSLHRPFTLGAMQFASDDEARLHPSVAGYHGMAGEFARALPASVGPDNVELRDHFAGQALDVSLHLAWSRLPGTGPNPKIKPDPAMVAGIAYEIADAMMAARKGGQS